MENTSNLTKTIVINELDNDTNKIVTSNAAEINTFENNNSHNSTTLTPLNDNIKPNDSEKTLNEIVEQSADIEANCEDTDKIDKTIDPGTPGTLNDESVTDASTEVLLDVSISDRLACLSFAGDASPVELTNHLNASSKTEDESTSNKAVPDSHEKTGKSAELCRSILAGEVSDNSECSVEEDEASDYVDDKVVSGDVSDEEMFIEDQEEDVEEEEEFHEVEEEKHKTSQESVGNLKTASSPKAATKSSTTNNKVASSLTDTAAAIAEVKKTTDDLPKHVDDSNATVQNSAADPESRSTTEDSNLNTTINVSDDDHKACVNSTSVDSNDSKSHATKSADWANLMQSNELSSASCQNIEETNKEKPAESSVPAEHDEKVEKDAEKKENIEKKDSEVDAEKGDPELEVEEKTPDVDAEKKELDLDEDVKNPQYIPKKGVFYEHDDRSHDVNNKKQTLSSSKKDEETTEAKESSNIKKSTTQEKQVDNRRGSRRQRTENDRWNHDLFKDEKQKPKSKSELINAYGYDIRQERASRNYGENRTARANMNATNDRQQQGSQENQRSRPIRDNRIRQNPPANRSREGRQRRPNNRNRNETAGGTPPKSREAPNTRLVKPDVRDVKQDYVDGKQGFPSPQNQAATSSARRDYQEGPRDRNVRNDIRGRRLNSKDRPAASNLADDKLPPINTVMPPITTWSNKIEDMVKEEASRKESPSRLQQQQPQPQHSQVINNNSKARSNDYWPQNQPNKTGYHERSVRNIEESRQHPHQPQQQQTHYNSRRYQDRDDAHRATQFVNRNHYNDRSNQHHQEWRRTNNYSSNHAKSSEYEPIKTQTFENSRLSQSNMNNRHRDAREIINERRMHSQQNFQPKVQPSPAGPEQQKQQLQQLQQRHPPSQQQHPQQHQQQPPQSQHPHQHLQQLVQHQQHMQQLQHQQALNLHQQPGPQQLRQPQQPTQQQQEPNQPQQQSQQPSQVQSQPPQPPSHQQQQLQNQRSHQQQTPQATQHPTQQRPGIVTNNMNDGVHSEAGRLNSNNLPNTNDLINSRPIIKTDAYTGASIGPHNQQPQPLQQHSQNHRSLGGSMSQGPGSAGSHMVPSHLGASGTQAQYYAPTSNSRDPAAAAAAAAALASAYHGYMPGGHSVMDANRYHMTPQQLSDHGYMASPGQANDVAAASVLLPQGMYPDAASAGGTVASSAYLAQAGSNLSPSTNIPVTGAGPPSLAPVSYLQHSQYAPPPYTNPYSQPQHNNQAPPQSGHAYPYWTYI